MRSRAGRRAALAAAVALACAVLTLVASGALGLRRVVVSQVMEAFPAAQIIVTQKQVPFLFFKFANPAAPLNEAAANRIAALPGVERVEPEVLCPFPAAADVKLLGQGFVTETCVFGVRRALVADALKPDEPFACPAPDGVVPAVISRSLLAIFNTGFAPSRGLPRLNENAVTGLQLDLYLGASTMSKPTRVRKERVRIVGVSSRVSLIGLSVPLGYARQWNAWWFKKTRPVSYHRLIVTTRSPRDVDRVARRIQSMGFAAATNRGVAQGLNAIARLLNGLVAAVAAALVALTAVGVLNASALDAAQRTGWIGLLRACGATRTAVVVMMAAESAAVAAVGGAAGAALAAAGAAAVKRCSLPLPAGANASAESLLAGWPTIAVGVAAGAAILAGAAALWPALRAAAADPADALKKG